MSDRIILLQRAQTLDREARQVRVEATRLLLTTERQCLSELAALLEAEARKLEVRADRADNVVPRAGWRLPNRR
jgi:hypothetical protein